MCLMTLLAMVLLLGVITLGFLWARSTSITDLARNNGGASRLHICSSQGYLEFYRAEWNFPRRREAWAYESMNRDDPDSLELEIDASEYAYQIGGVNVIGSSDSLGVLGRFLIIQVHYWIPFTMCGIGFLLSSWGAVRSRRKLFQRPYHCVHCGYNLQGTSGACPECGRERTA